MINLIFSTVNSLSISGAALNSTRVTNVTVLPFNVYDDLSALPEIVFVFSFLGCVETRDLNTRLTERYGPVGHIALTGTTKYVY